MNTTYTVWTGDGTIYDGADYDSLDEAVSAIAERRGYSTDDAVLVEHGEGGKWSVYPDQDAADNDRDGAYADSVMNRQLKQAACE